MSVVHDHPRSGVGTPELGLVPTALDALVDELCERIAGHLVAETDRERGPDGPDRDVRPRTTLLIGRWLTDELAAVNRARLRAGLPRLDPETDRAVRERVVAELTGAGPLEPYLDDPEVEEIDVNAHDRTWITYADGRKVDVGRLWASAAELTAYQKRLARRMTTTGEGRLDTSSPMLTLQTDDGARVVMVLGGPGEHGISTHPRLSIRRHRVRHVGLTGLAELGLFPHRMVPVLGALVRCGFTMLVSGPPGAGKTTLLTELLGEVPPTERIVTVEKHLLELRIEEDPRHPDAPALFTRHANAEGAGEVTTRQLVELTRRLNPDRVVVGELVEDEALDMLDVASMCARGSLATIHAHQPDIVLSRLAYYVAKSDTALPEYAVWNLISQTVDFVVHVDLVRNTGAAGAPVRRVTSIIEVGGLGDGGGVATTEVFALDDTGELVQVAPLSPAHRRRLQLAGLSADVAPGSHPVRHRRGARS